MPVFTKDSTRLLFIHIPKAGGSSVETLFKRAGFERSLFSINDFSEGCSPQHFHKDLLVKKIEGESFDAIFTIVRDPVSRIMSEYNFRMNLRAKKNLPTIPISEWIRCVFSEYKTNRYLLDNHIRPQNEFLLQGVQTYRYEQGLEYSIAAVLSAINLGNNIKFGHMPTAQLSNNFLDHDNKLSVDDIISVRRFYREDYDKLGY
jgi:hypothetical protein